VRALGHLKKSYLYRLWYLVGVIGRLMLVGQKVRLTQHAMQYNMDEQNNMIWRLSKAKVSLNYLAISLESKDGANFIYLSKKTQKKRTLNSNRNTKMSTRFLRSNNKALPQ
jgi:hypothetical protein